MIFLLGLLLGVLSSMLGVFLYSIKIELKDLKDIWTMEPDIGLRPWFAAVRRFFGGGPQ